MTDKFTTKGFADYFHRTERIYRHNFRKDRYAENINSKFVFSLQKKHQKLFPFDTKDDICLSLHDYSYSVIRRRLAWLMIHTISTRNCSKR